MITVKKKKEGKRKKEGKDRREERKKEKRQFARERERKRILYTRCSFQQACISYRLENEWGEKKWYRNGRKIQIKLLFVLFVFFFCGEDSSSVVHIPLTVKTNYFYFSNIFSCFFFSFLISIDSFS